MTMMAAQEDIDTKPFNDVAQTLIHSLLLNVSVADSKRKSPSPYISLRN